MEDTYVPPSSVNLKSTITVPNLSAINHIAYVKPGSLWVAGVCTLKKIDLAGNLIQTVDDALCYHGCFAVTENGDLFYIGKDRHNIKRKSSVETSTIVDLPDYVSIRCICISQKKGNLLVVTRNDLKTQRHRVVRYDINENISHVVLDDSIGDLYKAPFYITENRNGDIVVSDQENNAVIVVNSAGQNRFIIKTRDSGFLPCGLATDDTGNILVVEGHKETYIYVFDQDGILTRRLSEKRDRWCGVCLDDKRNLYVGNRKSTIDVYRY